METHSRILARMIPWTEMAGRLQSLESHRLKGLSTHTHTHTHSYKIRAAAALWSSLTPTPCWAPAGLH